MNIQKIKFCGMQLKQCLEGNLARWKLIVKKEWFHFNDLNFHLKKQRKEGEFKTKDPVLETLERNIALPIPWF